MRCTQLARSAALLRKQTTPTPAARAPARSLAPALLCGLLPCPIPSTRAARMSSKTRAGIADSEAGPGELPDDARKYGSGHAYTQAAEDTEVRAAAGCLRHVMHAARVWD